jgi:hypothetical protein
MPSVDDERLLDMAKELLDESQPQAALELARSWLGEHPRSTRAYELLAAGNSQLGRWNEAEAAAAERVRLDPSSARAWANWGTALRKVGRREEAQRAQQHALSIEPGHARAISELQALGVATPQVASIPLRDAGLLGTDTPPPTPPATKPDAPEDTKPQISVGRYILWAVIGFLGGWLAAFGGAAWAARHRKHPIRWKLGWWTAAWGVGGGLIEGVLMLCIYALYAVALSNFMDLTDDPFESPLFNPTWQQVGVWTGQESMTTQPFVVGANWAIAWQTQPGQQGQGTFRITIHNASTGAQVGVAADIVGAGMSESRQYASGTYYLQISTTQPYSVQVRELR